MKPQTFILAAALLLAGPALGQRLVSQTATPAAGQPVVLELRYAHAIRVRPGSGPGLTVRAEVTIADGELDRSYSLAMASPGPDGELRVEEKLDKELIAHYWQRNWRDHRHPQHETALRLDYEVTLPAGHYLQVNTVAGDVEAEGLTGAVRVATVSGDLRLTGLRGAVWAHTVSGDIRLRGLAGTAAVTANTVSGNVDADWPPATGAALSLKSLSGEVYADSTVRFSNLRSRAVLGYELRGQVPGGNGAPLVSLHTVSGDVFFRRQ